MNADQEKIMTLQQAIASYVTDGCHISIGGFKPPLAVRLTKRIMKLAQRGELPDFLDLCACFQSMAHHTSDHLEAVNAFLEKRQGQFKGK